MPEGRVGAAIIGTSFIGAVHLGALRCLGIDVRGVLGRGAWRGRDRAAVLGVPRAYASLDDLLADPGVAVIHMTSPNHLHFPQMTRLLEAGRHVVCEKPLAMTSAQSADMVERARASGLVAAVCYDTRFYPPSQHAHRMVAEGALGEVRLVTGHYLQDWRAREADWNWRLEPEAGAPCARWATSAPTGRASRASSPACGRAPCWPSSPPSCRSGKGPPARPKPSRGRRGPPSGGALSRRMRA